MAKLRSLLGFYAVILNAIPLFLVIITTILFLIFRENSEFFILSIFTIFTSATLPLVGLGFAISGLMKDKSKKWSIIGFIMSVLLITLFIIIFMLLILRPGTFVVG